MKPDPLLLKRVYSHILKASARARFPCPEGRGRASTTPKNRWVHVLKEEIRRGHINEQALVDLDTLLRSVAEKRRLTIDWRGSMLSNSDLIKVTAKRVGLVPPTLQSDTK